MAQMISDLKASAAKSDQGEQGGNSRLNTVLNLMAAAEQFQSSVHSDSESRKVADGRELKINIVYFGLAAAFGVASTLALWNRTVTETGAFSSFGASRVVTAVRLTARARMSGACWVPSSISMHTTPEAAPTCSATMASGRFPGPGSPALMRSVSHA